MGHTILTTAMQMPSYQLEVLSGLQLCHMRLSRLLDVLQMLLSRRQRRLLRQGAARGSALMRPARTVGAPSTSPCFGLPGDPCKQLVLRLCALLCLTCLNPGLYQLCIVSLGPEVSLCAGELHQTAAHTGRGPTCSQPLLLLVSGAASVTLALPSAGKRRLLLCAMKSGLHDFENEVGLLHLPVDSLPLLQWYTIHPARSPEWGLAPQPCICVKHRPIQSVLPSLPAGMLPPAASPVRQMT